MVLDAFGVKFIVDVRGGDDDDDEDLAATSQSRPQSSHLPTAPKGDRSPKTNSLTISFQCDAVNSRKEEKEKK